MEKQLNNPLTLQEDSMLFGMNGTEHGKFKAGFLGVHNLLHVQDQKANGVSGGTFTSGAWRTRDLNTIIVNNIVGASLDSNQITLPAGAYWCSASAPGYFCHTHKIRLYNITISGLICDGTTEFMYSAGSSANLAAVQTTSKLSKMFTLDITTVLEVQHFCEVTGFFGTAFNPATSSLAGIGIFADLKIWKLA